MVALMARRLGSLVEARAVKADSAISTAVTCGEAAWRVRGRRGRRRRRGRRPTGLRGCVVTSARSSGSRKRLIWKKAPRGTQ